jgi:plasmid replication initiation protein
MANNSKSLVTYDNDLNMIALRGMTQVENDVFFALLYKLKNQNTNEVRLDFSELKYLIGFEDQKNEFIRVSILNIAEKIAKSVVKYVGEKETQFFTLFQILAIPNDDNYYIRAKISEPFAYLLNELKNTFTAFDIAEFSALSSKYTQTLYRLLKQFKKTGYLTISWDKFIEIMDIPKSYKICDIDKQILKPAIKELTQKANISNQNNPIFKNLTYKKIRGTGRGRPVEKIEFYFTRQTDEPKEQKQSEKALEYIAQDIKKEQMLKELKRSSQEQPKRIDPFTGKELTGLEPYRLRNMRFKNQFGEYDILKIQSIEQEPSGKIIVSVRNVDDNHTSEMKFDSLKHFENTFNLHQI